MFWIKMEKDKEKERKGNGKGKKKCGTDEYVLYFEEEILVVVAKRPNRPQI